MKVGDLVALPRRRTKGLGIVLRYRESSEQLSTQLKSWRRSKNSWKAYVAIYDPAHKLGTDQHTDFADDFFLLNGWSGPMVAIKTKFVYIRWFKKPSEYRVNEVRCDEGWYPVEWVGKVKKVT